MVELGFSAGFVVELNHRLTNGDGRLIRASALEGALGRPFHGFADGTLVYPTKIEQAGALLHGLVTAHAFNDGNKRTGWLTALIYLEINGIDIRYMEAAEAGAFVEEIARDEHDATEVSIWLAHRVA